MFFTRYCSTDVDTFCKVHNINEAFPLSCIINWLWEQYMVCVFSGTVPVLVSESCILINKVCADLKIMLFYVILSTSGCHSLERKIHICPLYRWMFAPFSFCWKKRYCWILRSVSCKVLAYKRMINSRFDKAGCVIPAIHCVPIVWSRHTSALIDIGMFLYEFLFNRSSHFQWELGTSPAMPITDALSLVTLSC